jgi:hypothetical protein
MSGGLGARIVMRRIDTAPRTLPGALLPAGNGQKEREALELRQAGTPTDRSPRPPSCVSSILLPRPCRLLAVRPLLLTIRDHHQPAPAAARAALGLLDREEP